MARPALMLFSILLVSASSLIVYGNQCRSNHLPSFIYNQNDTIIHHSLLFTSFYYKGKIDRMTPIGSIVQFMMQRVGIYRPNCQQNPIQYQFENDVDGLWQVSTRCINDNFNQLIIQSRSSLEHYEKESTATPFSSVTRPNNQANLKSSTHHNLYTLIALDQSANNDSNSKQRNHFHLGYSQILIEIVDERNRHIPLFQQSLYTSIIYSNTPVGTPVIQVKAIDQDNGLNGQIMYRLVEENAYFAINYITGFVYVVQTLNIKYARQVFQFQVEAQDRGPIPYRSQARVTIDVINVTSYHPPQIEIITIWPLPTPASRSTRVAKLSIRDGDYGRYGTILNVAVQVINDNRDLFTMQRVENRDQYYVVLKQAFKQDGQQTSTSDVNQFYLRVTATDNGRPALTSQLNFVVSITPKVRRIFSRDSYQFQIMDCAPPGIEVGRLAATGHKTGVIYAMRNGNEEGIFTLSSQHGILFTKKNLLTYQQRSSYRLDVWGYRSFNEIYQVIVIVQVIPVHRYIPQFKPLPPSVLTLTTTQQFGYQHPIIQIHAQVYHPPYLNTTQDILYTIVNNQSVPFTIGQHSGLLTLDQQVDEIRCRQLHGIPLIIRALDQGNPYYYQSQVIITLGCQLDDNTTLPSPTPAIQRISSSYQIDSNQYTPQFRRHRQNLLILKLNKNTPPSSKRSIYTFYATDDDDGLDGLVMYVLSSGNHHGFFSLDYISGELKLIESLNETTWKTFQLVITAYDAGLQRRSTQTTLQIQLITPANGDDNSILYNSTMIPFIPITSYTPIDHKIVNITSYFSLKGNISYSLLTYLDYFQLDRKSGILKASVETPTNLQQQFHLLILLQNNSQGGYLTYRHLGIMRVANINFYTPQFDRSTYYVWLPNDIPLASYITRIHATDGDFGENGVIRYAPTRGGHRKWVVNRVTGTIYLGSSLTQPYEYQQQSFLWRYFHFLLRAKDRSLFPKVDRCYVDIAVVPRLPIRPQFLSEQIQVNIFENTTVGTVITDITRYLQVQKIENADRHHYVYQIINGNGLEYFQINSINGNITILKSLDYELHHQLWLTVQVTDKTTLPFQWNQLLVIMNIININDHPPLPKQAIYHQTIEENSPVGFEIIHIQADDQDCLAESPGKMSSLCQLRFHIIKGNENQYFYLNVNTGRLTIAKTPRLSQNGQDFMLIISISDGRWQTRVRIHIHLIRQQKAIIAFTQDHYKVDIIAQSLTRLSNFMLRVLALNRYNPEQRFYYTLLDDQSSKFTIESHTGIIQCSETLNQQNQYTLTVAAQKYSNITQSLSPVMAARNNPSSIATIRVRSISPSEVTPIPHFCDNYPIILNENLQIMAVVWYPKITSTNKTQLNYWIHARNDNYTFIISTDTGLIRLAHPLHYDQQSRYTLHISTTNGYQVAKCTIEIFVRNVNHYWPRFLQRQYQAIVSLTTPIGFTVLMLRAIDKDLTEKVTYSLDDHTPDVIREYFNIEKDTGRVILMKPILPYQQQQQFTFTVIASDNGQPQHEDATRILILVHDNSSEGTYLKFAQSHYTFQVPEETKIGLPVGQVVALVTSTSHYSLLPSPAIKYQIVNNESDSTFCIHENTGMLYVNKAPAFNTIRNNETILNYRFIVMASIFSEINITVQVTVSPAILSHNHVRPRFQQRYYTSYVKEAQPVNTYVTQLSLVQPQLISYSIVNQTINTKDIPFHIDPLTGIVRTSVPLNIRKMHRYTLGIAAQGINQLQDQCILEIYVQDINNHHPVFINQSYFVGVIQEEVPLGSLVYPFKPSTSIAMNPTSRPLHVVATDDDFGQNGNVSYKIVYPLDHSPFRINDDGTIQTRQRINFENQKSYTLLITAYDHGTPVRYYSRRPAKVIIHITDIHDQPPVFLHNPYQFQLYTPTYAGVTVGRVSAQSHGYGAQPVRYSIMTSNHSNFEINAQSGHVKVAIQNQLRRGTYELDILAYDQIYRTLGKVYIHVLPLKSTLRFHQSMYRVKLMENQTTIQSLIRVTAIGTQVTDRVEYKILNAKEPPLFQLDPWSGVLTSIGYRFDREKTPYYVVVIQAKDHRIPSRTAQTFVNITIEDQNDNSPQFLKSPYYQVIYRYWNVGYRIIRLETFDPDQQFEYKQRTLAIVSGNDNGFFHLDSQSGILSIQRDLTSALPMYQMIVRVQDKNNTNLLSTSRLLLRITNNTQPLFEYPAYTANIREDTAIGTTIQLVRAQSINNNTLTYTFEDTDELNPLSIDLDGHITLKNEVDYELQSTYNLFIQANDPVTQLTTVTTLDLHVIDINDHAPIFLHKVYEISINESLPIGVIVLRVTAIDADDGQNGNITYSLVSSASSLQDQQLLTSRLPFEVDPLTGIIKVAGPLDYERKKEYEFEIIARDFGQSQRLSDTTLVLVHILNTDDEAPQFEQVVYTSQVDIKANIGQFILCVQAFDEDENRQITYSIQYGNFNSTFRLDPLTGVIWLNRSLEHHRPPLPTYTLIIAATDGRLIGQTRAIVRVLQRAEDHQPIFSQNLYRGSIGENLPSDTLITTVMVINQYNQSIDIEYYYILDDYARELITINRLNGQLRSRKIFDRELPLQQRIQFALYAKTSSCRIAWTEVEITVLDENDNRPLFLLRRFQGLLPVGNGTGAKVVTVKALDRDIDNNAMIRYRIDTSSAKDFFTIGRRSGIIRTLGNINSIMSFDFVVRATDIADTRLYSTTQVSISMYDPSQMKPEFQHASYEYRISEETSVKTVITQLKAQFSNDSSRILSYNLANGNWLSTNSLQNFTLISTTGQLVTETLLDREIVQTYNLYAEAWASRQVPALTEIKITVLDSNDNAPQFTSRSYVICMAEDVPLRYRVIQVKASDADLGDNATFHYQFSPPTSDISQYRRFFIDPQNGWITTTGQFDREQQSRYELRIEALDHGPIIQRSSYVIVTIDIADVDDSPIQFSQPSYRVEVREDATIGSSLLQLQVIDNDLYQRHQVNYYIIQGDRKRYFQLDEKSGLLTLKKKIDRTVQLDYQLKVIASSGRHWTSTQVNITAVDITSYMPSCRRANIKMTLPYHIAVGTLILTIQPQDIQRQYYSNYTYTIYGGSKAFRIDPHRGQIRTLTEFQRYQPNYDLIIIATKSPSHNPPSCHIQLHVQFSNIDNKPPRFIATKYQATLKSYAPINHLLLQIMAIDNDEGQAGNLTYGLIDSVNGTFVLDSLTGQLYLGKSLMERPSYNYTLLAIASDHGEPKMSATTKIIVSVFNIQSLLPQFELDYYMGIVSEDALPGTWIANVKANPGYNQHYHYGPIMYTIIQQQPLQKGNVFHIDEKTGNVTLQQHLDYEKVRDYNVTIKCYYEDDEMLYDTATLLIHIKDKNDNRPQFSRSSYIVKMHKLTSAGTPIVRLVAYDRDSRENANIRYSILTPNQDYFNMDSNTGIITLARALDKYYRKRYYLTIQAKDDGSPSLASTTALQVIIDEVGAVFEPKRFTATVHIGTPVGTEVLTVKASNLDFQINHIYYQMLNATTIFQLGNTTGLLILADTIKPEHNHTLLLVDVYHTLTKAFVTNVEIFIYVRYNDELVAQARPISTNIASSQLSAQLGPIGRVRVDNPSWFSRLQYELEYLGQNTSVLSAIVIDRYYGNISIIQPLPTGRYRFNIKMISPYQIGKTLLDITINVISIQALENSVALRIRSTSIAQFLQSGELQVLKDGLQMIFPQLRVLIIGLQNSQSTESENRQKRSIQTQEFQFLEAIVMVTNLVQTQVINSKYVKYVINNKIDQLNEFTRLNISSTEDSRCDRACPLGTICYVQQTTANNKNSYNQRWLPRNGTTGFISEEYLSVAKCYCDNTANEYANCTSNNHTLNGITPFEEEDACQANPCAANEKCVNQPRGYQCLCQKENLQSCRSPKCSHEVCDDDKAISFTSKSLIRYTLDKSLLYQPLLSLKLKFRTVEENATLIYIGNKLDTVAVMLMGGYIRIVCKYNELIQTITINWITFNDGQWHQLQLTQSGRKLILKLDMGLNTASTLVNGAFRIEDMESGYVLLGTAALQSADSPLSRLIQARNFVGCIQDFEINDNLMSPWGKNIQSSDYMQNIEKGCLSSDLCLLQPCPSNHSVCVSGWNSYRCECPGGYFGPNCGNGSLITNSCEQDPCGSRGQCIENATYVGCQCYPPYTGEFCEAKIDYCSIHPCYNNGTCVSTVNGPKCQCNSAYSGRYCEKMFAYPCGSQLCNILTTCITHAKSSRCICNNAMTSCPLKCADRPCINVINCVDSDLRPNCTCKPGYYGIACEQDIDECLSNPCNNEGQCINYPGSFACKCTADYEGELCLTPKLRFAPLTGSGGMPLEDILGMSLFIVAGVILVSLFIIWRKCRVHFTQKVTISNPQPPIATPGEQLPSLNGRASPRQIKEDKEKRKSPVSPRKDAIAPNSEDEDVSQSEIEVDVKNHSIDETDKKITTLNQIELEKSIRINVNEISSGRSSALSYQRQQSNNHLSPTKLKDDAVSFFISSEGEDTSWNTSYSATESAECARVRRSKLKGKLLTSSFYGPNIKVNKVSLGYSNNSDNSSISSASYDSEIANSTFSVRDMLKSRQSRQLDRAKINQSHRRYENYSAQPEVHSSPQIEDYAYYPGRYSAQGEDFPQRLTSSWDPRRQRMRFSLPLPVSDTDGGCTSSDSSERAVRKTKSVFERKIESALAFRLREMDRRFIFNKQVDEVKIYKDAGPVTDHDSDSSSLSTLSFTSSVDENGVRSNDGGSTDRFTWDYTDMNIEEFPVGYVDINPCSDV